MTTALQITAKDNGPAVVGDILAPTINIGAGVPALMAGTTTIDGVVGGTETAGTNVGYRRVVSLDLSAKQYVQFQAARDSGTFSASRKWAAGGAAIIVFQDAAGHWSAFKFHGGDDSWGQFSGAIEGYFGAFAGFGSGSTSPAFDLDKSRAPDWSSGTLDWATIAAWEVHLPQMPGGSNPRGVVVGKIQVADPPISTGAVGALFTDLSSAWTAGGYKYEVVGTIPYAKATAAAVYCPHIGFQLGDGTTTTTGTLNSYSVAFWNCPEDTHDTASPFFDGTGAMVLASAPRLVDHFQAAGDSVTWNDCQFSSSRLWGWRTRGSTSATCAVNRCVFTRAAQFECAHGAYTDCIWDGHTAAIQATANTVITRGTIRNGVGRVHHCGGYGQLPVRGLPDQEHQHHGR
jgi:hypothetical protein